MHTPFVPLLLALAVAGAPDPNAAVLARINAFRKAAGLAPVKIDPELSKGCTAHARYLIKHFDDVMKGKLDSHDEDPKRDGYTPEGQKIARTCELASAFGADSPVMGVDLCMASLLHRIHYLDPALEKVGIGSARGNKKNWQLVMEATRGIGQGKPVGKDGFQAVAYPPKGQKGVPLLYNLGFPEIPNPIPAEGDAQKAGHPITVTFFPLTKEQSIRDVAVTLTDARGKDVSGWLSWPEKPAVRGFALNSVCLIPRAPLRANTTYTVKAKAKIDDRDWAETWSFTTGR